MYIMYIFIYLFIYLFISYTGILHLTYKSHRLHRLRATLSSRRGLQDAVEKAADALEVP